MDELQEKMLEEYKEYLLDLANRNSSEIFTNGGLRHASVLMSVLLNKTERQACIFCEKFSEDVIQDPYLSEISTFLREKKQVGMKILLESDQCVNEKPLTLIRQERDVRTNDEGLIEVRHITDDDKMRIFRELKCKQCNFSVFDGKMYRFEYAPEYYKAYGSFNNEKNCQYLGMLFDEAFNNARIINR